MAQSQIEKTATVEAFREELAEQFADLSPEQNTAIADAVIRYAEVNTPKGFRRAWAYPKGTAARAALIAGHIARVRKANPEFFQ